MRYVNWSGRLAAVGSLLFAAVMLAAPPTGPALDAGFFRPQPEPPGPSSRRSGVLISEVMYHPVPRADGRKLQFLELFNSQAWFQDLSNWQITGDVSYTFPTNFQLGAQSYVVIAAVPADLAAVTGLTNVLGPFTGTLPGGGGRLQLRHRNGGVFFDLAYASDPPWPAAPDGGGHSLVLARPSYGEGDPHAWDASADAGGSPGLAEPAVTNGLRTVVLNEILAKSADGSAGFLELYNYSNDPAALDGCGLTDDPAVMKFVFPTNSLVAAQGFARVSEAALGFKLSTGGGTVFLLSSNGLRTLDAVRFGPQEAGVSSGHAPDGAPDWQRLAAPTPGAANGPAAVPELVINELMYHPVTENDEEQYIELYNPGTAPVPLANWQLQGAVSYVFANGAVLAPQGYAVVARNTNTLAGAYPQLNARNLFGNFSGKMGHHGEHLALARPVFAVTTNKSGLSVTNLARRVVVDEVTYGNGGRWGRWSDGGGSSLELRDARADRRLAPNWADSDETAKSAWVSVEATGVLDNGNETANGLEILLYGAGECLVDNVEVIGPAGTNAVLNADFEAGTTGWFFQGNHGATALEATEGYNSKQSLHLRTTGPGTTGPNRVRTAFRTALPTGKVATLRARVRWLKGTPNILLRLHGNWLEAPGYCLTAHQLGTPGAPNSQTAANAPPALTEVRHFPVLPATGQPVTVTARAQDPDGLSSLVLRWRRDPAADLTDVVMTNGGAGLYSATIPGQASGSLVAFHLVAADGGTPPAEARFPDNAPVRECLVRWGESNVKGALGSYRIWMTAATLSRWSKREKLSNDPLDVTFAYGNGRAFYNSGGLYSGSPYHAPSYNSPTGSSCDYLLIVPPDDKFLGEEEMELLQPGNGGGDTACQNEQHAYWIAEQLGLPYCHRRSVLLYVNGLRRGITFEDSQQPNGGFIQEWFPDESGGELHKIQLWFEFDAAGSSFNPVGADLSNYLTTGGQKKTARYRWIWPLRGYGADPNNYTNLFNLVTAVNSPVSGETYTRALTGATDVDNWFRTHITEHLVGNNDSYSYGGGQNMYAYKSPAGTWKLLIWDIDFAFASLDAGSDMFGIGGQNIGPVNTHPPFARIYYQGLIDAVNGPLLATKSNPILDARYNGIRTNGGASVSSDAGLKSFVATRRNNLLNLINRKAAGLAITANGGANFTTGNNYVTLTGTAPVSARSLTVNGQAVNVTWTSLTNWTLQLPLAAATNALSLAGIDPHGRPITNAPATITITIDPPPAPAAGTVVLNELMHHPAQPGAAYLELRNLSPTTSYDLSGWRLDGLGFTFPPFTMLAPGAYAVIAEAAAGFTNAYGSALQPLGVYGGKLSQTGETLRLVRPGTGGAPDTVINALTYEAAPPWPAGALSGSALQLLDPTRDNNRVANWGAVLLEASNQPHWQRVVATGTITSSALFLYLGGPGEAYLDDVQLVAGTDPDAGPNLLQDGDFESGFPGPYAIGSLLTGSALTTTKVHSGQASLHLVSTGTGAASTVAIRQSAPDLAVNSPYTLSFWYLTNPAGGILTVRLGTTGLRASVNLAPGTPTAAPATPGMPNSLAATLPPLPPVWLNELATANLTGPVDRFGQHGPWVEVFNGGDSPLSLADCFLGASLTNLTEWAFPAAASVPAHGFLLAWLDARPDLGTAAEPHASFRPATDSGILLLSLVGGGRTNLLDYLRYTPPGPDRTVGDFPDGDLGSRHLFALPSPGAANTLGAPPLPVFINEWMADNRTTIADPADGGFNDWFELYNAGTNGVELAGFFLANSLTNRTQFEIPPGYALPGPGRLLVWADKKSSANQPNDPGLHANFKLSAGGQTIALFAPDGAVIDAVTFGPQLPDVSEGRVPDGGNVAGPLVVPTPAAANVIPAPAIFALNVNHGFGTVSWGTLPGVAYQLEAAAGLENPAWEPVGQATTANGASLTVAEPLPDARARYYRVRVLP